ncbi:MAG: crotonobetainyl-CoA:carnitine CoA-transferase CaiB-like acyl-CoA transferase [Halieaceae bacterium]|jgi:crotonobetainyl-CoA:carnitine CoA-transferase CaiB-like acyl-CoA transferase
MAGPMSGIKVIDLGAMIAGPMAATILCDQGADVIKIEPPGIGDLMRHFGATCNGVGGLYHSTNRGKRSLALDLKSAVGVDLVKELAASADVVLQNFRPGVAARLGVDYEALRAVNPQLIYLSVSGFGEYGPLAKKPAYDNVMQAFSGVAQSQANIETGEPRNYYQLFCDKLTALTGSQAISAALFARERGHGGQHISLSMVDSVVSFLWADVARADAFTDKSAKQGMSISRGVRLMQFQDGYGAAAAATDIQFQGYCRAFGEDASKIGLATAMERNNNIEELQALVRKIANTARSMTTAEAMDALDAQDVPCSTAQHLADLPAHPQMKANKSFVAIEHPLAGTIIEPNNAPNFEGTPSPELRVCADLGEHTDQIMLDLGRTDEDIARLRATGVIA